MEIRIRDMDSMVRNISRALFLLGLSLLACVFILCGAIFVRNTDVVTLYDIPLLSWIFWGCAGYLLVRMTMLRKY